MSGSLSSSPSNEVQGLVAELRTLQARVDQLQIDLAGQRNDAGALHSVSRDLPGVEIVRTIAPPVEVNRPGFYVQLLKSEGGGYKVRVHPGVAVLHLSTGNGWVSPAHDRELEVPSDTSYIWVVLKRRAWPNHDFLVPMDPLQVRTEPSISAQLSAIRSEAGGDYVVFARPLAQIRPDFPRVVQLAAGLIEFIDPVPPGSVVLYPATHPLPYGWSEVDDIGDDPVVLVGTRSSAYIGVHDPSGNLPNLAITQGCTGCNNGSGGENTSVVVSSPTSAESAAVTGLLRRYAARLIRRL